MDATIDYSTYTLDELFDENSYHIRLYARDGIINNKDDKLPSPIKRWDYSVEGHLQQYNKTP
jgi:hypothetical protein